MEKEIKRIAFDSISPELRNEIVNVRVRLGKGKQLSFPVKTRLTVEEMLSFVKFVVDSSIDAESASYMPESKDIATRHMVLETYANFEIPDNLSDEYKLLYWTPIYNEILRVIDQDQYCDIMNTIAEQIRFRVDTITSTAASKIHEMLSQLSEAVLSSATALGDIDPNDLKAVLTLGEKLNISKSNK